MNSDRLGKRLRINHGSLGWKTLMLERLRHFWVFEGTISNHSELFCCLLNILIKKIMGLYVWCAKSPKYYMHIQICLAWQSIHVIVNPPMLLCQDGSCACLGVTDATLARRSQPRPRRGHSSIKLLSRSRRSFGFVAPPPPIWTSCGSFITAETIVPLHAIAAPRLPRAPPWRKIKRKLFSVFQNYLVAKKNKYEHFTSLLDVVY